MADSKKKEENEEEDMAPVKNYIKNYSNAEIMDYEVLLMPFYDSNANVPKFFDKLLKSKDDNICMSTAVVLLRNNKPVADSILVALAAKDRTRGLLFTKLEKAKRLDRFPAKYKTQVEIARSYLLADKNYAKIDSVVFVSKQATAYNQKKGNVYFFKYRVKKEDDWKMGISGLQPENVKEVSSNDKLCFMTDKKIKEGKSQNDQFQEQLKKILFSTHKSAKNFYESDGNGYSFKKVGEYED